MCRKPMIYLMSFVLLVSLASNVLAMVPVSHKAHNPYPANGATDVDPNVVLSWSPGFGATWHDVYFGTSFDDVNNADSTTPNVYKGRQDANSYDPSTLQLGQTYYWRIDEVKEAIPTGWIVTKGDVWSFTLTGATFIGHFMTPEGEPYPFDVIISNGTWRKEWKNVTYIETEVPTNFTFTRSWCENGGKSLSYNQLSFSPGEIRHLVFYAINAANVEVRTRPYVAMEEVGANVTLVWEYDNPANVLSWNLTKEAGKYVATLVVFDEPEIPNWAITDVPEPPPKPIPCTPCSHHDDNCKTLKWHWYDTIQSLPTYSRSIKFNQIPNDRGIIRIRRILYNDAILVPNTNAVSRALNGTLIPQNFVDPQYVVPEGNYFVEIRGLPAAYCVPRLPVEVFASADPTLEINALYIAKLEPWDFSIIAEHGKPISQSSYSNLVHDTVAKTLTVNVGTQTDYDWWGCFVLPGDVGVCKLTATGAGISVELKQHFDYTVNRAAGYNLIAVRIPPEMDGLELTYCSIIPGDINSDCYVDFLDFAMMADNWLECSDPTNPNCTPTPVIVVETAK